MGRLIDADKLLEETRRDRDYAEKNGFMDMYYERQALIDRIEAQPTAYDPDKVVERLEELKKAEQDRSDDYDPNYFIYKAIEIVKGEYVTEQSCEWKLEDSESNLYVTECENRQLIFEGTPEENGYKYCPYCGRKIKRGGADGN